MLHKITTPDSCRKQFEWIASLQRRLLAALCDSSVTSATVTEQWVASKLPEIDSEWLLRFCRRQDPSSRTERKTALDQMRVIAGLPADAKVRLQQQIEHDWQLERFFQPSDTNEHRLYAVSDFPGEAQQALRGLFQSFYAPTFYPNVGYPVSSGTGTGQQFNRTEFLNEFEPVNPPVCAFCDGNLDGTEVDHFYPKSKYPHLSCHPLNLVPSCPACNGPTNKNEHVPLDQGANDQMAGWFHPYLRPLADWQDTNNLPAATDFDIRFERQGHRTVPVPYSSDPDTQSRIEKLDQLVNLKDRWTKDLRGRMRATIDQLHLVGDPISEDQLKAKLRELAENKKCEIGLEPRAILHYHYLRAALEGNRTILDELVVEGCGADVLTAEVDPA